MPGLGANFEIEVWYMAEGSRCSVCGKLIEAGEKVAHIEVGTFGSRGVSGSKRWGLTHAPCFYKAMPTPKAALSEIKRLARESMKATV